MAELEQAAKKQRVEESSEPTAGPPTSTRKTKPCAKFFSVSGCPYWSGCNFMHANPTGMPLMQTPARTQMSSMGGYGMGPEGDQSRRKTKLCNKFNTPGGCPFGSKCSFAHGEHELNTARPGGTKRAYDAMSAMGGGAGMPQQPMYSQYPSYGASQSDMYGATVAMATATMTIRADAVGVVIGKGGANVKQINSMSGARVKIADATDPNQTTRVVEMSGTVEQITVAQDLVRHFVSQYQATAAAAAAGGVKQPPPNFKTKLCENFLKGSCNYGDRCHFAHGEQDLHGQQVVLPAPAGPVEQPQYQQPQGDYSAVPLM
mmetsp:Transcript_29936/g.65446  ORF Transcript_29936/g.65446 Transcript_29936/m.65446 type:complete len:317 (-) Transcript_29936:1246-2196(-)|eukprot:CAMPEP_0118922708 /NCGR_PEP_ID=MMETSP1169-20130426/1547_1 /TAXON_ID=36882 /ORGANISM="Pyramimonas obovata, Strain CCMP722" /LENGTH=316 /DNA_ID=CAMNT_0006863623 /DNA_START=162 /DNA_END=1112 /DNA_ORIENTATION=-